MAGLRHLLHHSADQVVSGEWSTARHPRIDLRALHVDLGMDERGPAKHQKHHAHLDLAHYHLDHRQHNERRLPLQFRYAYNLVTVQTQPRLAHDLTGAPTLSALYRSRLYGCARPAAPKPKCDRYAGRGSAESRRRDNPTTNSDRLPRCANEKCR